MSFVAKWFGGGGESSSSNQGSFVGGTRGGTQTAFSGGQTGNQAAQQPMLGQIKKRTQTKYTGPLGLSTQADTAKKYLLGE
jgi:hypothetical protein